MGGNVSRHEQLRKRALGIRTARGLARVDGAEFAGAGEGGRVTLEAGGSEGDWGTTLASRTCHPNLEALRCVSVGRIQKCEVPVMLGRWPASVRIPQGRIRPVL